MASWLMTEVVMNKQVTIVAANEATTELVQGGRVVIKVKLRLIRVVSADGEGGLDHAILSAYVGRRIHANGELSFRRLV